MLRKRKDDWLSVTTGHPEYIRFYTSLWLVLNDVWFDFTPVPLSLRLIDFQVIIGIALGSYIVDNSAYIADSINEILSLYSIGALTNTIMWLKEYPVLKNPDLPF